MLYWYFLYINIYNEIFPAAEFEQKVQFPLPIGDTRYAYFLKRIIKVGWSCLTSHRQRGHLETVPPFTVPCKGREARFLHQSHRESNLRSLRDSPLLKNLS